MRRREVPAGVRFVTFSCFRRLPLLHHSRVYEVFASALRAAHELGEFELYAWVAMPEHVHLLMRPRERCDLARPLRRMKMSVAKRVLERWKELNAPILAKITTAKGVARFWQAGGGFDRNVRGELEFAKHVRYIHRNPVERGLVADPWEWTWSSVGWWRGERNGEVACDEPPGKGWRTWNGFV